MKKTYKLIALLLVAVTLLCSCSSTVVETTVQPTVQSTPTPTPTPTPMPTRIEDIGRIVYAPGYYSIREKEVRSTYYDKNKKPCIEEELGLVMYNVDDSIEKEITWNYLGVDFELQYQYSGCYDDVCTDDYVDVYSTNPHVTLPTLLVGFLHGTKQPLYIQYDIDDYNNPLEDITYLRVEEDYVNLIKLHNQEYFKNSSDYDLECVITYDDYGGEKVTYTNLDEIKNTGRYVFRVEVFYHPDEVSGLTVQTSPYFRIFADTAYEVHYVETDFHEYTQPIESINITEIELWCAYQEAEKFAREHFKYTNADFNSVDYKLADPPFIPSETTINVLNGRLYLVIEIRLVGEWGGSDIGEYLKCPTLYVDYQRLQWKMALEGKT